MKKALSLLVAVLFLISMSSAQAWKSKKRHKYPRINPYTYGYPSPYANPYASPYSRVMPYGYLQAYRGQQAFNRFPMFDGGQNRMPWSQAGGSSFSNGFPMMSGFSTPFSGMSPMSSMGFGSPLSGMSPMGFGSPFSGMSPMSPMGFGSPFSSISPMSPMGFGSPFGSSMPFNSMPFGNTGGCGRSSRSGFMPF